MGRIRTVKPELFLDEVLGALSGDHALFFVGLFTVADREGRLRWRPERLKATLFPYRAVDVAALGADLDAADKVQLYEVSGESYLWIPGFTKHQRPHPKEPASDLPAAPSREKKRPAVISPGSIPSSPVGREGKGREGDLGKEEDLPRAPPAGPRVKNDTVGKKQEPTRPGWRALIDRLTATYLRIVGAKYDFRGHDAKALAAMLDRGVAADVVEASWARALAHQGFPQVRTLPELDRNLNHFLGAPRRSGPDPNQGITTHEGTDAEMWEAYRENRKAEGLDG